MERSYERSYLDRLKEFREDYRVVKCLTALLTMTSEDWEEVAEVQRNPLKRFLQMIELRKKSSILFWWSWYPYEVFKNLKWRKYILSQYTLTELDLLCNVDISGHFRYLKKDRI